DQPDYPLKEGEKLDNGNYLVYLDVWERHLTYIEDDLIREVALGGPDTATRAKIVWQVKVLKGVSMDADLILKTDYQAFLNIIKTKLNQAQESFERAQGSRKTQMNPA
ncbi:MAG: hypothetical protein H0T87_07525, partial [Gammaproteobacteria bacterium]|nr:hypothetical protein [Gammaproteobacteria bacterium]